MNRRGEGEGENAPCIIVHQRALSAFQKFVWSVHYRAYHALSCIGRNFSTFPEFLVHFCWGFEKDSENFARGEKKTLFISCLQRWDHKTCIFCQSSIFLFWLWSLGPGDSKYTLKFKKINMGLVVGLCFMCVHQRASTCIALSGVQRTFIPPAFFFSGWHQSLFL